MQTRNGENGFSYIDVMIAITILSVGILGATSAITAGLIRSYESEKQVLAKDAANSVIESIFTARDQRRPTAVEGWQQVGNIGTNPIGGVFKGIFVNGWAPVRKDPGYDGVFGTMDDACATGAACPNADGTFNSSEEVPGFSQKIEITDLVTPNRTGVLRRRVDVTIRYPANQDLRQEKISTMVTLFD